MKEYKSYTCIGAISVTDYFINVKVFFVDLLWRCAVHVVVPCTALESRWCPLATHSHGSAGAAPKSSTLVRSCDSAPVQQQQQTFYGPIIQDNPAKVVPSCDSAPVQQQQQQTFYGPIIQDNPAGVVPETIGHNNPYYHHYHYQNHRNSLIEPMWIILHRVSEKNEHFCFC